MEKYDYAYELADEQLIRYSRLPAKAKLAWLDAARKFTLMARRGRRTYFKNGRPVKARATGSR